jgi:hypothetical protein
VLKNRAMKFKIFSRTFLPLFFIIGILGQVKAQWGAPIYGLSSAPDSAYMIATEFYKGIKGQPYYLPIDMFMNRYGGDNGIFTPANKNKDIPSGMRANVLDSLSFDSPTTEDIFGIDSSGILLVRMPNKYNNTVIVNTNENRSDFSRMRGFNTIIGTDLSGDISGNRGNLDGTVVIGPFTYTTGGDGAFFNVVVGYDSHQVGEFPGNTILGAKANTYSSGGTALGRGATVSATNGTAIGVSAVADEPGEIAFSPGSQKLTMGTYQVDIGQFLGPVQDNYVLTYDNALNIFSAEPSASGADGNGIISTLPLGSVNIDAASNQFNITNLSSLDFSTDGTGSAESSFNLSKLSAIATRVSHEDPADVNNASELILDFDGNTQLLSGDGQDIAIGADANLQLNADSVRIGNLPTQKIHDNWIYEIVANSAGYLHPVVRSYGFMTCSNEVQAITVTGGGAFDVITNGTNNLFSTIIQEGDFTIQGDSIIIDRTGVISVDVSASIIIPAGALGRVKILINGTAQTGGAQASDSASADAKVFSFPSMLNVSSGDVLKIGYQAVIGGNITVNAASVKIKYE